MNKKEAAEALNISTRLVERYAGDGRLGAVEYVRGKTGKQADFKPDAVERLRVELETPDTQLEATNRRATGLVAPSQIENLRQFAAMLEAARPPVQPTISDISHKLTLSVSEAARLSGFSKDALRDAIRAGELKAKIIAGRRGWTIKRPDLESYVSKL
jgi:excisionase family DNA binding protein